MFRPPGALFALLSNEQENSFVTSVGLYPHARFADDITSLLFDAAKLGGPANTHREAGINALATYSAYFFSAGMRRALAGESYVVPVLQRASIECVAYAAHLVSSEEAAKAWILRHDDFLKEATAAEKEKRDIDIEVFQSGDKQGRNNVRQMFGRSQWEGSLKELLKGEPRGPETAQHLLTWYDYSIDMGAHPNILLTLIGSKVVHGEEGDTPSIFHALFSDDSVQIASTIENLAHVGSSLIRTVAAIHFSSAREGLLMRLENHERSFLDWRKGWSH